MLKIEASEKMLFYGQWLKNHFIDAVLDLHKVESNLE